ncbi:LPXTG cell wall anchor domain-containing protein [Longispora sp. K20-0274]|uniref:LPXTG cell wall anchor domain-containing protein n=1 Tax=Longispora sp. K20-0274 TaxID=3088255 RepID=UPI00399BECD0
MSQTKVPVVPVVVIGAGGATLPVTGVSLFGVIAAGIGLLVGGALLIRSGRRRTDA